MINSDLCSCYWIPFAPVSMECKPTLQVLIGLKRNNAMHCIAATALASTKSGGASPHHAASARQLQPTGGSLRPLHKPRIKPRAGLRARLLSSNSGPSGLFSVLDEGIKAITITTSNNPSQAGCELLEALRKLLFKTFAKKQRLGHYVDTRQNGRPMATTDDALHQQSPPPSQ